MDINDTPNKFQAISKGQGAKINPRFFKGVEVP